MYGKAVFSLFFLLFFSFQPVLFGLSPTDSISAESKSYVNEQVNNTKYFSEKDWNDAKKGIEYEQDKEKPQQPFSSDGFSFFNYGYLKYLFYVLIFIAFVAVIAWLALKMNAKHGNIHQKPIIIKETENLTKDELMLLELDSLISDAIKNKDFYLSTRLLYLKVLQQMVKNQIIEWRKDQTNRTIYSQLKNQMKQAKLKSIFWQYELVWYGQKAIIEPEFNLFFQQCEQFISSLQKPATK